MQQTSHSPAELVIDVTTLRGRRATHRWERTSIGDVFERLTWSHPHEVALSGAHGEAAFARVTNLEADAAANRFAHGLAERGLEPGDRVLLVCENTVEAFLAKVGIAKAGMVAVPFNPNLAPDVMSHLLELTRPGIAVVDAELWPRVADVVTGAGVRVGATILAGGDPVEGSPSFGEFLAGRAATEPDVEIHGDDVWQLLFTSGTTSLPKGVMITHHSTQVAALSFATSMTRGLRHECDVRLTMFLPMIYHIGDQLFPFGALMAGGTVHIGRGMDPANVAEALAAERTTAYFVGSQQFAAQVADELDRRPELDVTSLGVLVYGWGALAPDLFARLDERCGGDLIAVGVFGQTESIVCHRFWPTKWPEVHAATAPAQNYVGIPSPMLSSDVVDELDQPVRGEPGEAVYRSPVMMAGYYRNEEATREAFRGGWFHTGDSVLVEENGLRVLVDRYKDIVKSGGENVSSMRVEAVLQTHPDVLRAAVVGLAHDRWGEAVTAVVVRRPGTTPAAADLIAYCRERLAGYETPKQLLFVDALPETVGGKILKYRLRETYSDLYTRPGRPEPEDG